MEVVAGPPPTGQGVVRAWELIIYLANAQLHMSPLPRGGTTAKVVPQKVLNSL